VAGRDRRRRRAKGIVSYPGLVDAGIAFSTSKSLLARAESLPANLWSARVGPAVHFRSGVAAAGLVSCGRTSLHFRHLRENSCRKLLKDSYGIRKFGLLSVWWVVFGCCRGELNILSRCVGNGSPLSFEVLGLLMLLLMEFGSKCFIV